MKRTNNTWFYLSLGLITVGLIYLLSPVLTPFFAGALLAYLLNPAVGALQKFRLPRVFCVSIVFFILMTLIVLMLFILVPMIENQIFALLNSIPDMLGWIENTVTPWVSHKINNHQELIDVTSLKSMLTSTVSKVGTMAETVVSTALHSGMVLMEWTLNLILIPVVTFYLLCDWKPFLKGFDNILPRHIEPTVVALIKECDAVLSEFFRGQLLIILILAVYYSMGLTIVGLQVGIIIGTIAAVLSLVPYLGFIVGLLTATIAAYVQTSSMSLVMMVTVVFIIGHILENMVLTPNLIGHRIGLHPVVVIFAVLAGGSLFGFSGVLLALPAAAVIMVLLRFLHSKYRRSDLYRAT